MAGNYLGMLLVSLLVAAYHSPLASSQRQVIEMHGSGSNTVSNEMTQVMYTLMGTAKPAVYTTYRAIGTSGGRDEFMAATATPPYSAPPIAYGLSGLPLPTTDYTALQPFGGVIHIPTMLAKVSFFHSVLTTKGGTQVLNLTACTLAKIYTRAITVWDHADIRASNPSLSVLPGTRIVVLRRLSQFSPTVASVVQYLASSCPAQWQWGTTLASIPWPSDTLPMDEDTDMLNALTNDIAQVAQFKPNAIGFIDAALGLHPEYNLTQVALQLTSGASFQTASMADNDLIASSLAPGVFPTVDADWGAWQLQRTLLTRQAAIWPILMAPYLLLRKNSSFAGMEGGLLPALVTILLGDEQQVFTTREGHIPLPLPVRRDLLSQATRLLQLNSTAPIWNMELDNAVQKGAGAGDFTLSFFRKSGLVQLEVERRILAASMANISENVNQIWTNLTDAVSVREELREAIRLNTKNEEKIQKAFEVAVAAVVISVILAFIALVLAAVYVGKVKKLDEKVKFMSITKYMRDEPDGL